MHMAGGPIMILGKWLVHDWFMYGLTTMVSVWSVLTRGIVGYKSWLGTRPVLLDLSYDVSSVKAVCVLWPGFGAPRMKSQYTMKSTLQVVTPSAS